VSFGINFTYKSYSMAENIVLPEDFALIPASLKR